MTCRRTPLALLTLAVAAAAAASSVSGAPRDVLGAWTTAEGEARINIHHCGQGYCGEVVWLREPKYPPDSPDGPPGEPKLDVRNPDPALRGRPVLGLAILQGFHESADRTWEGGTIYDPKKGKTHRCRLRLLGDGRLELRSGPPLLGKTIVWTRSDAAGSPAGRATSSPESAP